MTGSIPGYAATLRAQGYCVVRGCIPPDRVNLLANILESHFRAAGSCRFGGKYDVRGMNLSRETAQIICDDKLLELMKECSAPGGAVLTGECDFTMNTTAGWHKDTTDKMELGSDLYENPDFAVYKMAIYLQDQTAEAPEVFKVKPGSHLRRGGHDLPATPVSVKAGDVVIFDLRLDHAGHMPSFFERLSRRLFERAAKPLHRDPERMFTGWRSFIRRGQRPRLGIFVTFGPDTGSVYAYEKAARSFHGQIPSSLDSGVIAALATQGVQIIQYAS